MTLDSSPFLQRTANVNTRRTANTQHLNVNGRRAASGHRWRGLILARERWSINAGGMTASVTISRFLPMEDMMNTKTAPDSSDIVSGRHLTLYPCKAALLLLSCEEADGFTGLRGTFAGLTSDIGPLKSGEFGHGRDKK